MRKRIKSRYPVTSAQRGFSLLEVIVACAILFVGLSGLLLLGMASLSRTNGQGNQATKTTEYAQDKMEAILSLQYTTALTNTTADLTATPTNLTGTCCGLTDNSTSCNLNLAPGATGATGCYTDYVTPTGTPSSSPTGAQYVRRWRIQQDTSGKFLTITVQVQALSGSDYSSKNSFLAPMSTLSAQMAKD